MLLAALACAAPAVAAPPAVTFERSLPEVYPGETMTVRWSSPDATRCRAIGWADDDNVATSGEQRVDPPDTIGVVAAYSVRCRNGFGPANATTATVTTTVVAPSTVGSRVFDTGCRYSHAANDDPIVHPGSRGASHLHEFFGNASTDAFSTGASLLAAGRAELAATGSAGCQDVADHSARWPPALYRNGVRMVPPAPDSKGPRGTHFYYRGDTSGRFVVQPFPTGFGMVAAHPDGTPWTCGDSAGQSATPVHCGPLFGRVKGVTAVLRFPHWWNGWALTAGPGAGADEQWHVSRTRDEAHPIRLPTLTGIFNYGEVNNDNAEYAWSLSSGGIETFHADILSAWEPFELDRLVHLCLNTGGNSAICHDDVDR